MEPETNNDTKTISEEAEFIRSENTAKKRKKRLKITDYTLENDIKYRGPLSYRHLRILAWICLFAAQICVAIRLISNATDSASQTSLVLQNFLSVFSSMMMPLFLMAMLTIILNRSKKFGYLLILYGVSSVIIFLLFVIVYEHYLVTLVHVLDGEGRPQAAELVNGILREMSGGKYFSFNIFIDLFVCTLFAFFILQRPKAPFVGKKEIWFRLFAMFPVLYEIASFILKTLATYNAITLSPYLYPLLTTKPPMTFVVFVLLVFFIKMRERIYRKRGKTHADYTEFLQTNANSWQFSTYTASVMGFAALVDFLIMLIIGLFTMNTYITPEIADTSIAFTLACERASQCGIGASLPLILVAPIMLLFSYTRTHSPKTKMVDTLMPYAAVGLIVVFYIETIFNLILAYLQQITSMA